MPLLKLKNASYPEPDALALVNEYDLGRDGSKWRHGWVPTNAIAAAIKAKKPTKGGSVSGKSRLSTSTVRPSRVKVADTKGRAASAPEDRMSRAHAALSPGQRAGLASRDDEGVRRLLGSDDKQVSRAAAHELRIRRGGPAPAANVSGEAKSVISDGKNMSAADHTRMAIHHNEEAKKALDAGDRTKANAHVEAMRAHNSAALQAASADDIVKLREAAQPGPQKDAVNAEIRRRVADPKTTNSTGLRTLGGYGTNDLKAIVNQKGAYASSPSSADTIAKAEAELKSRGYVKGPTGAWAKPKALARKSTGSALPTKQGRSERAAPGTHSVAGVKMNDHVGRQSPSADRIGAEAAQHAANARANEAARQSPARDALVAKRSAIRAEMAKLPSGSARKAALARQLTTINRKLF